MTNQKLTVRQQTQLDLILRDGDFSTPVGFAKCIKNFTKIRYINKQDARVFLGFVLTIAANFAGLKNPISDINKNDIREMVMTQFSGLTLEEIHYAFKHNRYSGEPIEHYQLFNAEYVSKVLKRYQLYITQIKKDNNILLSNTKSEHSFTEEEKAKTHEEFLKMVFEQLKKEGFIDCGWLLYEDIVKQINTPIEVKKRLFKFQKYKFLKYKPKTFDFEKNGKRNIQNICRNIVVSNFLKRYTSDFETFKKILS